MSKSAFFVLPTPETPLLVSRVEAARLLSCSDRHVDALCMRGVLREVRAGRRRLITRESLEAFVSSAGGGIPAQV